MPRRDDLSSVLLRQPSFQPCSNLYRGEKGICYRTENADGDMVAKGQALNVASREELARTGLPVSTMNRELILEAMVKITQPENGGKYSISPKQVPGFKDSAT